MTVPWNPASPGAGGPPLGDRLRAEPAGGRPGLPEPGLPEPGLPEIVIAPAHPAPGGGRQEVVFELREGPGATAVLPVFSSVRRLVDALGDAQPWVALPLRRARQLASGRVAGLVLDPQVQPGAWRWGYGDLETLQEGTE